MHLRSISSSENAELRTFSAGGGRGGGFGNKRFGAAAGAPREAQQFYCEVCKISCAGQLTYKEHLEGQRHKKKEALAKGENNPSLPKSKVSFRCDLCNVTCTGQDTYNAHVRGAKHQKTLTLCKKLGKPIPSTEPTIIPPSEMGGVIPPPPGASTATTTSPATAATNRVVGISTVNFVAGAKLSTTAGQLEAKKQQVMQAVGSAGVKPAEEPPTQAIKGQTEELQALIAAEQSLKPVGEEFVEAQRDATGKLLQYLCKLCDCKFSDPNAKEIHLKGRRHRLQYKMKVDPNLEVEVKPATSRRGTKYERGRAPPAMMPRGPPMPLAGVTLPRSIGPFGPGGPGMRGPWFGNGPIDGRRFESTDDRHVQAKHTSIYPNDEQLTVIERLVTETEKALKKVSDYFNERDHPETKPLIAEAEGEKAKEAAAPEKDRLLKGVMRVGMLSKGLLLKDDTEVHLVVLCSRIPGLALLKEVASLIPLHYEKPEGSTVDITLEEKTASMILRQSSVPIQCRITLTSREFREDAAGDAAPLPPPGDALDKEACLKALAQLRHAKWFQARCIYLQSCQITLRILRDIRARIESWRALNDWMSELLVEKVLSSCLAPLSVGDALRRVFEAVASGVLLKTGPGIADPCEKEAMDVLAPLTGQQREAITASAQHALRLIAFNQLYKVLGLERLPDVRPPLADRKRPMDTANAAEDAAPLPPPGDALDKEACLKALAQLRHAKWFQARCIYLQSCQITLRILRDIRARIESWRALNDWMSELLVEKVLSSCLAPLSVGDALRRVFEAVASGVLLKTGPGIADPCEKEAMDVLAPLTGQQREAITASAQHALRLIAFNQLYKVLGLERLPDVRPPLADRKRPMDTANAAEEVKKDKKEGENGSAEPANAGVAVKMEV
ncbi:zinc finger, C2H2 type [Cooperia oncophora]